MKRFIVTTAVFAFSLSVYGIALAHGEGHRTLVGTITAVDDTRMTISTIEQKSEVIELSPSATYLFVDGEEGKRGDLREGTRVVVKLKADGLVADEVRYGPARKKTMPEEHKHGGRNEYGEGHEHHHGDGTHE